MAVPVVRLGPARVDVGTYSPVDLADSLVLDCSECGELTDEHLATPHNSAFYARRAHRHAEEAHDGDVERVGWV